MGTRLFLRLCLLAACAALTLARKPGSFSHGHANNNKKRILLNARKLSLDHPNAAATSTLNKSTSIGDETLHAARSSLSKRIWKSLNEISNSSAHTGIVETNIEPQVAPRFIRKGIRPHGYVGNLDRFRDGFSYLLMLNSSETTVIAGATVTRAPIAAGTDTDAGADADANAEIAIKASTDKRPLTVCVIGGSMTWGPALPDKDKSSAWPAQAQLFLQNTQLFSNVSFINMALPGAPSSSQVMEISKTLTGCGDVDLVLVDLAVNDRVGHPDFSRETAKGACNAAEGEVLMDALLTALPNHVPVWYLETFVNNEYRRPKIHSPDDIAKLEPHACSAVPVPHRLMFCPDYDVSDNFHWYGLLQRGIPVLSYPDVACHVCQNSELCQTRGNGHTAFWNAYPHPDNTTHHFVGRIVAMSLLLVIEEALVPQHEDSKWSAYIQKTKQNSTIDKRNENSIDVQKDLIACALAPLTFLEGGAVRGNETHIQPFSHGSCWEYTKDYKERLGWICQTGSASLPGDRVGAEHQISFHVNVSCAHPMIIVQVLRSNHISFGKLDCWFQYDQHLETRNAVVSAVHTDHFTIDTQWGQIATQKDTMVMTSKLNVTCPMETVQAVCEASGGMVKITAVSGC